jgi:hypothetical protein
VLITMDDLVADAVAASCAGVAIFSEDFVRLKIRQRRVVAGGRYGRVDC